MSAPDIIYLWPEDCPHYSDVADDPPRLEIYRPARSAEARLPAMVICPGGGYSNRAEHEASPFAWLFAQYGMVGIVCHYRVNRRFPASYTDTCRAMRLIRADSERMSIDPQRIGLMGFSAGGHNACTVATQPDLHHDEHDDLVGQYSARPDRLVLAYPVISLVDFGHVGSRRQLLGEEGNDELGQKLSGQLHVDNQTPPTFLFHTSDDPGVSVENSLAFAQALRAHEVAFELHSYAHGGHGVGMAASDAKLGSWTDLLISWLDDWRS